MAGFGIENGRIQDIRLYPISLHMERPRSRIGVPSIAPDESVLRYLAELSLPFGTKITVEDGVGVVRL